jgi:hypothetical protein
MGTEFFFIWVQTGPFVPEYHAKRGYITQNKPKQDNRLVHRLLARDQGVGGSNPLSPTINFRHLGVVKERIDCSFQPRPHVLSISCDLRIHYQRDSAVLLVTISEEIVWETGFVESGENLVQTAWCLRQNQVSTFEGRDGCRPHP